MAEIAVALETTTQGQCSELAADINSDWVCSDAYASGSKCVMQCQELGLKY